MDKKKIIITGGHHNSALVVAEELRQKGYQVIWFGHKYSMWGDKETSSEYKEVTKAGFKFVEIRAGKLYRTYNPRKLALIPWGFWQSFYYLVRIRPNLILSFGGYLAVPVVISGWLLRIPLMTHEQTAVYGLANKVIALFAQKILLSWKSSLSHFPAKKAVFTGLPLRAEIFEKNKGRFDFKNKLPTIYITGGKQGSHLINQVVRTILPSLVNKYNLIHQCGSSSLLNEQANLQKAKSRLPANLRNHYLLRDYIFRNEIGNVFAAADLIVSRSGAHITYEVAARGKLAIFIPISWSSANEQLKNAQILVKTGVAIIIPEEKLTAKRLLDSIENLFCNSASLKKNIPRAKKLITLNATEKIIKLVEEAIGKN